MPLALHAMVMAQVIAHHAHPQLGIYKINNVKSRLIAMKVLMEMIHCLNVKHALYRIANYVKILLIAKFVKQITI